MRIGMIGAGAVGGILARQFVAAGHDVAVANSRGPQTLTGLVTGMDPGELGGRAEAATVPDAARYAEVAVLAIPFSRYPQLPAAELAGRVVVDCTNYFAGPDGRLAPLDEDRTTSTELVAEHLPGARMVKAFNTMAADHLRDYAHCGGPEMLYGMPVSSDDDQAKRVVMDLVEQLGFDPVDAGGLAGGGRLQQPGGPAFLADLPAEELRARLGTQF
jgi:8-hydroxy-5-deazaflavin:NADPH oxidoreductase